MYSNILMLPMFFVFSITVTIIAICACIDAEVLLQQSKCKLCREPPVLFKALTHLSGLSHTSEGDILFAICPFYNVRLVSFIHFTKNYPIYNVLIHKASVTQIP